jgi:hypothetical protein
LDGKNDILSDATIELLVASLIKVHTISDIKQPQVIDVIIIP